VSTTAEPSWRIERRDAHRLVLVTTQGPFSMKHFMAMVPEALAASLEPGYTGFVFDHRLMVPKLTTSEIYRLPTLFERQGWTRGMRVAVVHPPGQHGARQFEFFASLAVARSFQYQLFAELDAAIAWAAEEVD